MENIELKLLNYNVTDISFAINREFKQTKEPIQVNPIFSRSIAKLDENTAVLAIRLDVKKEENKPFFGAIIIQGTFKCLNWETNDDGKFLINETTTTILFPYLRQAVSEITTILNVPTYLLPIVNTVELFNKHK